MGKKSETDNYLKIFIPDLRKIVISNSYWCFFFGHIFNEKVGNKTGMYGRLRCNAFMLDHWSTALWTGNIIWLYLSVWSSVFSVTLFLWWPGALWWAFCCVSCLAEDLAAPPDPGPGKLWGLLPFVVSLSTLVSGEAVRGGLSGNNEGQVSALKSHS